MPDLLVRLYDLPDAAAVAGLSRALAETGGVQVRRAVAHEKLSLAAWTYEHFSIRWAGEADVAFARQPIACFLAADLESSEPVGFAAWEATARNFFGPMGVLEDWRGKGIGRILLLESLLDMRAAGYAYAIIGGAGDHAVPFYQNAVRAQVIEGSKPGIYPTLLDWGAEE